MHQTTLPPSVAVTSIWPPADAPVVQRRLLQHDEAIGRGHAQLAEVVQQCLVQAALGLAGVAGEHRDLVQDEVVAAGGWQLEVLAGVLHDVLQRVLVRDAQRLHQGGVRGVQERLLLGC